MNADRRQNWGFSFLQAVPAAFAVFFTFIFTAGSLWADDATLAAQIRSTFTVHRYEAAVSELSEFKSKYPKSPLLPELELLQAQCCPKSFEALKLYSLFSEKYPDNALAPQAVIESGRLYLLSGDANSAIREGQRLKEKYPSSDFADDAFLLIGEAYESMGRYSFAANEYASLLALHPKSPLAGRATIGLADAKLQLGNPDAARDLYNRLLEINDPRLDYSHVYYSLAQIAEKKGERAYAVHLYRTVADQMPSSFFSKAAGERLKELTNEPSEPSLKSLKPPPATLAEEYAVQIGVFPTADYQKEMDLFQKSGFRVSHRLVDNDKMELYIGNFSTKLQADFFAEELVKKFGKTFLVIRIK